MKNKITLIAAAAASTLALTAGAASAQSWASINQRQANLDARIDAGLRTGELSRGEAANLRADYRAVADLLTSGETLLRAAKSAIAPTAAGYP